MEVVVKANEEKRMMDDRNYVQYKLHGFKGLQLDDNEEYSCVDNEYISKIYISSDLKTLKVELKEGVAYIEHQYEIETFLDSVCFNMISLTEIETEMPYRKLETIKDGSNIHLSDRLEMRDSMQIIRRVPAENFYDTILNGKNLLPEKHVLYQKIFQILHNPNIVMQFLILYDWLLVLLSGDKRKEQKYIHIYLGKNRKKYPEVMFEKSKDGKSVDMFTNLRNQIAHYEQIDDYDGYREIGEKIPPLVIRTLVKVINDVICENMQDV